MTYYQLKILRSQFRSLWKIGHTRRCWTIKVLEWGPCGTLVVHQTKFHPKDCMTRVLLLSAFCLLSNYESASMPQCQIHKHKIWQAEVYEKNCQMLSTDLPIMHQMIFLYQLQISTSQAILNTVTFAESGLVFWQELKHKTVQLTKIHCSNILDIFGSMLTGL